MIQTTSIEQSIASNVKRIRQYIYSHDDFLGNGNFSKVYKGLDEQNNHPIAIKIKDLSYIDNSILKELHISELDVLPKLNHPNVVKCYDIIQEENYCYIITELCQGGDLDMFVKKKGYLSEEAAAPMLRDILEGLLYMSEMNIIHRDLKVANVFLSGQTAKIADFGFAVFAKESFKDANIGSPLYMSPEVFKHSKYGPKTDVWAFGALIFQLLHGDTPYSSCILQKEFVRQLSIPFNRTKIKPTTSPDLKEVICRCLEINESKRITVQQLRETSYFKRIYQQQNQSNFCQPEMNQRTPRIHFVDRQNVEQKRGRSIERLASRESGRNIKITFNNNGNGRFVSPEKPYSTIQNNTFRPPLPPSQLNLPVSPSQRPNNFIQFARPISSQKIIEQSNSPEPLRTRILSIDPRKSMERYKIFNSPITFKISVTILHYCRCLYRYIQILISVNEQKKQLRFLCNWLILMLEELKRKVNDNEIMFNGNKKQAKMQKFREVRTDYERKYMNQFKPFISNFINKPTLQQVKVFLFMQYRKYDYHLSKESRPVFLQIAVISVYLYDATRLMKKCQEENDFVRLANYKDLEQVLLFGKEQFNDEVYMDIKKRILINA